MAQCLHRIGVHTTYNGISSDPKAERRAVDIKRYSAFPAQVPWTCSRHLQGTSHFTISHFSRVGLKMEQVLLSVGGARSTMYDHPRGINQSQRRRIRARVQTPCPWSAGWC